jgi:hypothetical protein
VGSGGPALVPVPPFSAADLGSVVLPVPFPPIGLTALLGLSPVMEGSGALGDAGMTAAFGEACCEDAADALTASASVR